VGSRPAISDSSNKNADYSAEINLAGRLVTSGYTGRMRKMKRPSPVKRAIVARLAELSKQLDDKRIELEKLEKAGKVKQAEATRKELHNLERQHTKVSSPFLVYWIAHPSLGAFPWRILQYCSPEIRYEKLEITFREAQIAYGVSLGPSNAEIADVLVVEEQTVGTAVSAIYRKIGMEAGEGNRAKIVLWYITPLVQLPELQ
jgi:Bacterial regulatory proteins, luxR family